MGRIDIITGTLRNALGGARGGFSSARRHIAELSRHRSRPYLSANSVSPHIVARISSSPVTLSLKQTKSFANPRPERRRRIRLRKPKGNLLGIPRLRSG